MGISSMRQSRLISFGAGGAGAADPAGAVRLPARLLAGDGVRRRERRLDLRQFRQGVRVLLARHPVHRGDRRAVDRPDRVCSIAIGGYLVLGEHPVAVAVLRWLYRWPLFIPFIVAGQLMRTFLAKNGMMNNILVEPRPATSRSTRRAFSTGAASSSPSSGSRRRSSRSWSRARWRRSTGRPSRPRAISAPARLRVLLEIVVPQVRQTAGRRR